MGKLFLYFDIAYHIMGIFKKFSKNFITLTMY